MNSVKDFRTVWKMFWTVWNISGQSRIYHDSLEDFWKACKIFGQSGEFPDRLEDFRIEWKVFRHYGRFQAGWKIFGNFGRYQDGMGSMLLKHIKPERNSTQTALTGEMHIDWNEHVVSRADHLLRASLDWLGRRGRWHFMTGANKFYTSEVGILEKSEVSRLFVFLIKFLNVKYTVVFLV